MTFQVSLSQLLPPNVQLCGVPTVQDGIEEIVDVNSIPAAINNWPIGSYYKGVLIEQRPNDYTWRVCD